MKPIEYSDSARKFLLKSDKALSKNIVTKIEQLSTSPDQVQIKKLRTKENLYRIRVGDYRIIFQNFKDTILIISIGHRKDVYK